VINFNFNNGKIYVIKRRGAEIDFKEMEKYMFVHDD